MPPSHHFGRDVATSMVFLDGALSTTYFHGQHQAGKTVRNMQFEPPSRENAPFTQIAFLFGFKVIQT